LVVWPGTPPATQGGVFKFMEVYDMKANLCTRMMACAVIVGILAVVLSGCPDFLKDDPTVTVVTVSPDTVSVPKGGTQSFSATVRGTGNPAQTVIWALSGNNNAGTTISDRGLLTVAANEISVSLIVRATSTVDTSKYRMATVTITTPITVSGVTVSPATVHVVKGGTQSFSATVTGTGSPAQTVTWAVNGSTGTTINTGGVLTVAVGETVTSLTVTATSTVDTSKSGTATVTVFALSEVSYQDMVQVASRTITGEAAYGSGAFPAGRTVSLSAFKIAKYETTYELWYTVKQWAADKGYSFANAGREGNDGTDEAAPTSAKFEPVTMISWRDAIVWCNAYSQMSGKQPVYYYNSAVIQDSTNATACDNAVMDTAKNGYRLPTEAEWEYAARGGGTPSTSGSFVYTHAGSNTVDDVAWYGNTGGSTHKVGGKIANTLGLYDMSGNVWEWCWDWLGSIGTGTVTDPTGPTSGTFRVHRGGSWYDYVSECAVASRYRNTPDSRGLHVGFRVVCP
jgi:formylglycine-generating enzyme required for sulfatase activity